MRMAPFDYTDEDVAVAALLAGHYASAPCVVPESTAARKVVPVPPALPILPGAWVACALTGVSKLPPILLVLNSRISPVFAILPLAMVAVSFRTRIVHVFAANQSIVVLRTHAGAYGEPSLRFFRQHYVKPVVRDMEDFLYCEWCAADPNTMPCTECGRQVCGHCTYMRGEGAGYVHMCPRCVGPPDADVGVIEDVLSVVGM